MRAGILVLAICLSLGQLSWAIAPSYTITDLGTLDLDYSTATGINNAGTVVGYSFNNADPIRSFTWTARGGLNDIGGWNSQVAAQARKINDAGTVVGYVEDSGSSQGAYWQSDGIHLMTATGVRVENARDINASGQIAATIFTGVETHPAIWKDGQAMDLMADDPLSGGWSYALNDQGVVVGYRVFGQYTTAWLWSQGQSVSLGRLPTPPYDFGNSTAWDINNAGLIVGRSGNTPVIWEDLTIRALPGGDGEARAINSLGQIVGGSSSRGPTLWEGDAVYSLRDYVLDGSGWNMYGLSDINDAGQIVGFGVHDGQSRGFLLTPVPEPATLSLLALGGLAMVRRGRKLMLSVGFVLTIVAAPMLPAGASTPSIQLLGKPDALTEAMPTAISDDGTVVAANSYDTQYHGAMWTPSTGWFLPVPADQPFQLMGLSGDGTTAIANTTGSGGGCRWTASHGVEYLPPLASNAVVRPYAISYDGSVVVGTASDASLRKWAYRWSASDGVITLRAGVPNETSSEGAAVTGDGKTFFGIGYQYGYIPVGFQRTSTGGVHVLPVGSIRATNSIGTILAGADAIGPPTDVRPYIWSEALGKQYLPVLSDHNFFYPEAISDSGIVVGSCSDRVSNGTGPFIDAWIWSADRGTMLLADYLSSVGVDTTGITFADAPDITPDGNHIVCRIWRGTSSYEAAIVTIPEPATLSLLGLGGLAVVRRRSGSR